MSLSKLHKRNLKRLDSPIREEKDVERILYDVPYEKDVDGHVGISLRGDMKKIEIFLNEKLKNDFETYRISILELAIYNSFLASCLNEEVEGFTVLSYGELKDLENIKYGGAFKSSLPWWFSVKYKHNNYNDINIIFQTKIFRADNGNVYCQLNISFDKSVKYDLIDNLYDIFRKVSFNNSEYKGKCLEIKIDEGNFEGIVIIPTDDFETNLVLTDTQERFISHFEKRILRGSHARYLLNGDPGTGKTQVIRRIIKNVVPNATFIMPDFTTSNDLKVIMEACEIFSPGVVIMDDIDIYIGSRDKGSQTNILSDFLSYFDGIKKRNISLLASTNDKSLVDKAAERPGRFNITLDFTYLEDEQIDKVINMHLSKKWRTKEVYDCFKGNDDNGKKIKVTGAFIANLAENIIEMSENDKQWTLKDTLTLIKDSYKGFYSSQITKKTKLGFQQNYNE